MPGVHLIRTVRSALAACMVAGFVATASAQTVVNPGVVEFYPSDDHSGVASNGARLVDRYVMGFYLLDAAEPFQTVDLGKPGLSADGRIRVDFVALLSTTPAPGITYEARVTAVGPGGSATSDPSNTFMFQLTCAPQVAPTSQSAAAGAASASVAVTVAAGCSWTAVSNAAWLSVTAGASGNGNGTVAYNVSANTSTSARTGTLTVAGLSVAVTQAAAPCTYAVAPASQSAPMGGATFSVAVTAGVGCTWTAVSNASWVTVTAGATGNGNGTVAYTVAANTAALARTGTLSVAGQTVTVAQVAAATCTYAVAPASQSAPLGGGAFNVAVTAGVGCAWTASSNVSWLTVSAGASGTGNGSVTYSVAANTTSSARTGTLTVGGQTVSVTQPAAPACTVTVTPTSRFFGTTGGVGSVAVTATAGCAWTAVSNAPWLTVTAGSSGTGNGTVTFSVAPNTTALARTGTLALNGQTVTVTEAGTPCSYTLSPSSVSVPTAGGTGTVTMTTQPGCAWTAGSTTSWVTVSGSGSGTGSFTYTVAPNTTGVARSGLVLAGGRMLNVAQP